jgi:hypothetical protein
MMTFTGKIKGAQGYEFMTSSVRIDGHMGDQFVRLTIECSQEMLKQIMDAYGFDRDTIIIEIGGENI